MKRLLVMIIIGLAAYQGWQKISTPDGIESLYQESYVVVYGRDSCGWTQQMIRDLKIAKIKYYYRIVDDKQTADILHTRMQQSGISVRRYNLPVIDVNGMITVRPDPDDIISRYFKSL